jgi:ferric-dicitrate binding protein FerR (iron transport regulator)
MTHQQQNLHAFLDQSFARFRAMSSAEVESACERVLDRLRQRPDFALHSGRQASHRVRSRWTWSRVVIASTAAAAILAFVIMQTNQNRDIDARAVVEMADGSLNPLAEGEVFRTNEGGGAVLSLRDQSRVEVRAHSELSIDRAHDGVRIRLSGGSVIVNASRQRGHLYVQTKDLAVTVLGTVFLVNVEDEGSRVAVIQGKVRVRQGTTETDLTRDEQVVTSPQMKPRKVSEQISWSRNAEIHLAQLQQSAITRETIEERCGPSDLRSIVRDNGGWNLRLPGVLWRKYKCQHEGDS